MSKRLVAMGLSLLMTLGLVSCTNKKVEDTPQDSTVKLEDRYKDLNGVWTNDITFKIFEEKYDELNKEVIKRSKGYGLDFDEKGEESIKVERERTINKKFIYFENENPDKNKLESLYFGRRLFGEDLASGQIILKLSLNFDGEGALSGKNSFDFGDTSLAAYSQILTGEENRDYGKINEEILNILKSESGEGVYQNTINGLYEEFTVTKDYIVYTLETKELEFVKEGELEENIDGATTTD